MIIGITGKIGSGKTYLVDQLKQVFEFVCINTDFIWHEIIINNQISPGMVAVTAFEDKKSVRKLSSISYPIIRKKVIELLEKNKNQSLIVVESALLFDLDLIPIFDEIIVVFSEEKKRLSRLCAIKKQINNYQMSQEQYLSLASKVVYNV